MYDVISICQDLGIFCVQGMMQSAIFYDFTSLITGSYHRHAMSFLRYLAVASNERHGVIFLRHLDRFSDSFLRTTPKKTSKLCISGVSTGDQYIRFTNSQ